VGGDVVAQEFAACDDPVALQAICDRLGPGTLNVFVQRVAPPALLAVRPEGARGRLLVEAPWVRRRSRAPLF
jgi:hypothetical protein